MTLSNILTCLFPGRCGHGGVGSGNETGNEHLAHRPVAAVKTGSGAEELSAVDVAL